MRISLYAIYFIACLLVCSVAILSAIVLVEQSDNQCCDQHEGFFLANSRSEQLNDAYIFGYEHDYMIVVSLKHSFEIFFCMFISSKDAFFDLAILI